MIKLLPEECYSCHQSADDFVKRGCLRDVCWMSEHQQELPEPTGDPLLAERAKTHGNFVDNANFSQRLKLIFADHKGSMDETQREALDMIAVKLSRILSGQANYADHWDDIAGYAKLASEATKP